MRRTTVADGKRVRRRRCCLLKVPLLGHPLLPRVTRSVSWRTISRESTVPPDLIPVLTGTPRSASVLSVKEVEVLASGLHRMDQQLVAAVEAQDDDLKQATCGVEAETELPSRAAVVQVTYEDRVLGGMDSIVGSYAVPLRRGVDLHST